MIVGMFGLDQRRGTADSTPRRVSGFTYSEAVGNVRTVMVMALRRNAGGGGGSRPHRPLLLELIVNHYLANINQRAERCRPAIPTASSSPARTLARRPPMAGSLASGAFVSLALRVNLAWPANG